MSGSGLGFGGCVFRPETAFGKVSSAKDTQDIVQFTFVQK